LLERHAPVFDVERRGLDGTIEVLDISPRRLRPFFGRKRVRKTDAARVARTLASLSLSNRDGIRIDLRQRQGAPLDRKLDEHQSAPHEFVLEMMNSVPRER
jgi:hypothetical protein